MSSEIILIANDFGYGPTSHALSIAKALQRKGAKVRLVTAYKNDTIIEGSGIAIDHIDDLRSTQAIASYLENIPSDVALVSVLNRFAIEAAHSSGRPVILVDDLFWFWSKTGRPVEYSSADLQIRCVLPWQLSDTPPSKSIAYTCVSVDSSFMTNAVQKTGPAILSLNGLRTPFYTAKHDAYAQFMSIAAGVLAEMQSPLVITGPSYIKDTMEATLPLNVPYQSFSKSEYLEILSRAPVVYLNGGLNSFLEAVVGGVALRPILPSNQSQYALLQAISETFMIDIEQVCPLLTLIPNHHDMTRFLTEKEAIDNWSEKLEVFLQSEGVEKKIRNVLQEQTVRPVNIEAKYQEWQTAIHDSLRIDELIWSFLQAKT